MIPVRLFAGGRQPLLLGDRCFTAATPAGKDISSGMDLAACRVLLDSGAFSDRPEARLTPAAALERQILWERQAGVRTGLPGWQADAIVSYDLLIDEVWHDGTRTKRRWSVADAEHAVAVTVQAARFLAGQRAALTPRTVVLSAQGVDADQYARCAQRVLEHAGPDDWLGLGGWCIIGRFKSWLPAFCETISMVLPTAAEAGVRQVHLFGVLWPPAVGRLTWLADQYDIALSVDSTAPLRSAQCANGHKAGVRAAGWNANVAWWRTYLASIRTTAHYREPEAPTRQLTLWEMSA